MDPTTQLSNYLAATLDCNAVTIDSTLQLCEELEKRLEALQVNTNV